MIYPLMYLPSVTLPRRCPSFGQPGEKILLEREFWIAVMRAQKELGVEITDADIASSEAKIPGKLGFDPGTRRDYQARCKKARLEEFADLSGHQHAHKGMTSRDLTENVEQLQVHRSLGMILEKATACLLALADRAEEFKELSLTARSHNVPAQLTTLGKRLANWGEELERSLESLTRLCATYPYRGLKGQWVPGSTRLPFWDLRIKRLNSIKN